MLRVQPELAALDEEGFQELMYAYVACMAVHVDYRRRGIASELLNAAEIQVCQCRIQIMSCLEAIHP